MAARCVWFFLTAVGCGLAVAQAGRIVLGVSCGWTGGCILICDTTAIQMNPGNLARVERRDDGSVTITISSVGGPKKQPRAHEVDRQRSRSFVVKTRTSCEVKNL